MWIITTRYKLLNLIYKHVITITYFEKTALEHRNLVLYIFLRVKYIYPLSNNTFHNFHSTLLPIDVNMESGMDQTPLASKDGIIQA